MSYSCVAEPKKDLRNMTQRRVQHGKQVAIARTGEDVKYKAVPKESTVKDIFSLLDIPLEKGETFAVNGKSVTLDYIPQDKEVIYIADSSTMQ